MSDGVPIVTSPEHLGPATRWCAQKLRYPWIAMKKP
jgi:hypothetical protein